MIQVIDYWVPGFAYSHPWFSQFLSIIPSEWHHQANWPSIPQYNQLWSSANVAYQLNSGKGINFVPQKKLSMSYENYIYQTGEIPSRENNWHDFFNFLIWMLMPKTKIALNAAHIRYRGETARTNAQSTMAQFDETGVIVCAHQEFFLDLLWNHHWEELFIENRDLVKKDLKFIIFGHGLLEKSLSPFLGMTGKSLLVKMNKTDFDLPEKSFLQQLDSLLTTKINAEDFLQYPQQLAPLPMLGVPGWWPANKNNSFYGQKEYFRPRREYAHHHDLCILNLAH